MPLPSLFIERLRQIIPAESFEAALRSFQRPARLSVRINTLVTEREQVVRRLEKSGISFIRIPWCGEALILDLNGKRPEEFDSLSKMIAGGQIYRQGLSSMIPALILDPKPGEKVLDLCAAPGSKTSQMAAMMNNEGEIAAVESVRGRFYKLKSVCASLGVRNAVFKCLDGRRFRSAELFDKILVDAPCSSEGRFKTDDPKTYRYWSPRKIKEMVAKQRGLLFAAARLVRPGGMIVYSTCSFSPEENEGVIDWLLKKTGGSVALSPACLRDVRRCPPVLSWQGKSFDGQADACLRVLPDQMMEGFFVGVITRF